MAHLTHNSLLKYKKLETMHPVAFVSKMTPMDEVVLRHVLLNNHVGGKTTLHGERLKIDLPKHPHTGALYSHLVHGKTHLMEAMCNDRGGGLGSALKSVGKAIGSFAKGAGKNVWKGLVKGAQFYGKHSKAINQTLDVGLNLGGAMGLFDEDTMDTLGAVKTLAGAYLKKKDSAKNKPGKGYFIDYSL